MDDFHRIRLGLCNSYLLRAGRHYILIDAGRARRKDVFHRYLKKAQIAPGQVRLIIITHVHFDHVGGLKAIRELCKCPVAIHESEASLLKGGVSVIPPGTKLFSRAVTWLGGKLQPTGFVKFAPVNPDILISTDTSLVSFGIPGNIILTPGHTHGSLSVLLSSGEAFVGDLAANYLPFGFGPILPPFAEDMEELLESWRRLLSAGARKIFPAHGQPFPAAWLTQKAHLLSKR